MKPQSEPLTPPVSDTELPVVSPEEEKEEEAPLVEVTEMGMDDVMLLWDGQSAEFNEELRNRPETNCYGYWQKKLAEQRRKEEEAAKQQASAQERK